MYRGGLQSDEALALYPRDLDTDRGTIPVLHGKGDQSRIVGLDDGAWAVIDRCLDRRKELGCKSRHPLFRTLKGGPVSDRYVRVMVKRLAKRAGIFRRVNLHGLRHTHAFELANEGPCDSASAGTQQLGCDGSVCPALSSTGSGQDNAGQGMEALMRGSD